MSDEALKSLLAQSRVRNKKLGITGMLLHFGNQFIQLIEGDEKQIRLLYADICADSRHKQIVALKAGGTKERLFPDWSMSFKSLTPEEIASEPAYKDVYTPGSQGALDLVLLFNFLRGKTSGQS